MHFLVIPSWNYNPAMRSLASETFFHLFLEHSDRAAAPTIAAAVAAVAAPTIAAEVAAAAAAAAVAAVAAAAAAAAVAASTRIFYISTVFFRLHFVIIHHS